MTEAQWLASTDPQALLAWLMDCRPPGSPGGFFGPTRAVCASARKLRLFACACVRQVWHVLTNERCQAVEIAEHFADGEATAEELRQVWHQVASSVERRSETSRWYAANAVRAVCDVDSSRFAQECCDWTHQAIAGRSIAHGEPMENHLLASLLREIMGNPFRNCTTEGMATVRYRHIFGGCTFCAHRGQLYDVDNNAWVPCPQCCDLRPEHQRVIDMAERIYSERLFDNLPFLADALEEAGCTDRCILDHCRGPDPHVKGCWVLDLILEKE